MHWLMGDWVQLVGCRAVVPNLVSSNAWRIWRTSARPAGYLLVAAVHLCNSYWVILRSPPPGEPVLQCLSSPFLSIEDQQTKGGHEKQAAISAHPEKGSTKCHGQYPPLTASGPKGEVLRWLLRTWLDGVRILDVRHSDRRAPQDIRRLGRKKTRIMQLSENARFPPTPALSRSFPWKPHLHSGPAEHRWQCCPTCQNKCEARFWFFFSNILLISLRLSFGRCGKSPEKSPDAEWFKL